MLKLPVNYNDISSVERKRVREIYAELQDHKCHFCGGNLYESPPEKIQSIPVNERLFPIGFFKYQVHLHHDHQTGMTIGAVHNYCNALLWQYYGE